MKLVMELTEKEIEGLKSFIKRVKHIPMVEGVYIVPFISEATNKERISVVSIKNNTEVYNRRIFGLGSVRKIDLEEEKLRTAMDEYDRELDRLSFVEEDTSRYTLPVEDYRGLVSKMALVSGTILYDRLGTVSVHKDMATGVINACTNVVPVENVSEVSAPAMRR